MVPLTLQTQGSRRAGRLYTSPRNLPLVQLGATSPPPPHIGPAQPPQPDSLCLATLRPRRRKKTCHILPTTQKNISVLRLLAAPVLPSSPHSLSLSQAAVAMATVPPAASTLAPSSPSASLGREAPTGARRRRPCGSAPAQEAPIARSSTPQAQARAKPGPRHGGAPARPPRL